MGVAKFHMFLVLFIIFLSSTYAFNGNDTSEFEDDRSVILSRRKRFIVFPEGSSFQLVFCVTYPMIFQISDIFLYGYTAALAFELPQDPYSPFDHKADPLHRRSDTKTIYFTDYKGKVLFKKPYKRKPIVNPAFAKRSVDGSSSVNSNQLKKETIEEFKIDRKQMHASKHKRDFLKSENMEGRSVEFHRSSRASLYGKIETMFQAHGVNGRQCLLKTLCLIGQSHENVQESFLQEILRAVFTLPITKGSTEEKYQEYDEAYQATDSCSKLYPDCEEPNAEPELMNIIE